MATGRETQFQSSESDSDDEFFDALANEDKTPESAQDRQCGSKEGSAAVCEDICTELPEVDRCVDADATSTEALPRVSLTEMVDKTEEETESKAEMVSNSGDSPRNIHAGDGIVRTVDTKENGMTGDPSFTPSSTSVLSSNCQDNDAITDNSITDCIINEGLNAEEEEVENGKDEEAKCEDAEAVAEVDDEQARRDSEDALTEEERMQLKDDAQTHKARGNELFKHSEFLDAVSAYTEALSICPLCYKKERSIMYANRAACRVRQEQYEPAIQDCNKALELHPHYLKVWLRRANTYELMEKLDDALADFQKVLELDPGCYEARAACVRLPDQIKERNEKLKAEMFGKLKDLGNLVLRPFGLSTDNFQLQQDPNSGSYSVNFRQNQPPPGNGN